MSASAKGSRSPQSRPSRSLWDLLFSLSYDIVLQPCSHCKDTYEYLPISLESMQRPLGEDVHLYKFSSNLPLTHAHLTEAAADCHWHNLLAQALWKCVPGLSQDSCADDDVIWRWDSRRSRLRCANHNFTTGINGSVTLFYVTGKFALFSREQKAIAQALTYQSRRRGICLPTD